MDGTIHSEHGSALTGATITVAPVDIDGFKVPFVARPSWSAADGGTFRIGVCGTPQSWVPPRGVKFPPRSTTSCCALVGRWFVECYWTPPLGCPSSRSS